jgi:hypothetical protein
MVVARTVATVAVAASITSTLALAPATTSIAIAATALLRTGIHHHDECDGED